MVVLFSVTVGIGPLLALFSGVKLG
jgi:hypothetical protein